MTQLSALAAVVLTVATSLAATPELVCQAAKNKVAGKYAACRGGAEAKFVSTGDVGRYVDTVSKCADKLSSTWSKTEGKATATGGSCPTEGDEASIKGKTDAHTSVIAFVERGLRFEDNGNGTVTDHLTGLQWEKKTNLNGGANYGDPHDADNTYTWSTGSAPNGTIFFDFLDKLNGGLGNNTCFAGHCDWRLPSFDELLTIRLVPYGGCPASPCIDPVFGPTMVDNFVISDAYWSYTSPNYSSLSTTAEAAGFGTSGQLYEDLKTIAARVRAVRRIP